MANSNKSPNRLIYEKSPYLLQHAHDPVDWYPWGEEAFDKAKTEDKPISSYPLAIALVTDGNQVTITIITAQMTNKSSEIWNLFIAHGIIRILWGKL